jgi:hypothetical protein
MCGCIVPENQHKQTQPAGFPTGRFCAQFLSALFLTVGYIRET